MISKSYGKHCTPVQNHIDNNKKKSFRIQEFLSSDADSAAVGAAAGAAATAAASAAAPVFTIIFTVVSTGAAAPAAAPSAAPQQQHLSLNENLILIQLNLISMDFVF